MKLLIPPPVQGLIAGFAVWGLAKWFPEYVFSFPGQKPLAVAIASSGLLIDLVSVFAFFRAKTTVNPLSPQNTNTLVVSGLYKISRNPMYLGMLLILAGWTIWLGNPLGVLPVFLFIVSITYLQIKPEEHALEEKFGDSYRDYKQRVRRWI